MDDLTEAQMGYLEGRTVVEVGRQFTEPLGPDDLMPLAWNVRAYGEPDTTKPCPGTNKHPMRWVQRTVIYGPWEPINEERAGGSRD